MILAGSSILSDRPFRQKSRERVLYRKIRPVDTRRASFRANFFRTIAQMPVSRGHRSSLRSSIGTRRSRCRRELFRRPAQATLRREFRSHALSCPHRRQSMSRPAPRRRQSSRPECCVNVRNTRERPQALPRHNVVSFQVSHSRYRTILGEDRRQQGRKVLTALSRKASSQENSPTRPYIRSRS